MDNATVRVRPLRFAFVVEPKDKAGLLRVFETNSALWGGIFNFVIPLFKQVPQRYREKYFKTIPAEAMLKGFVEAFQPDYLVELNPGAAASYGIVFPDKRLLSIRDLSARDEQKRCKIGIDLRSICDDLYRTAFRFVQRHPPKVVIPSPTESRFSLLFAATFGSLPESGPLADVSNIFLKALEGKRTVIKAVDFPKLFGHKYYCPLEATNHELDTFKNSWAIDSKLFYMDETSPWDLIEFWNLRAIGWHIEPLPASLAPDLIDYCNDFIRKAYRPFPPPSNAYHHATMMCARSQPVEKLQEFMKKLTWVPNTSAASWSPHVPRIWEEWGRSADHAEPQTVEHSQKTVEAHVLGGGLDIRTQPHDFANEDPFCSQTAACANVLKSYSGGTPIIPWKSDVAATLTRDFGETKTWISREGIVLLAGEHSFSSFLRVPSPINIFSSMAESLGYKLDLSPAGRTCEQIIHALGSIRAMGLVTLGPELLRFLDRLAHEDLEVDADGEKGDGAKRKKLHKGFAPLPQVMEVLERVNANRLSRSSGHLDALIRSHVLKLGMTLRCTECQHTGWFSLENLKPRMSCPHCLKKFNFPSGSPPQRNQWAYRVIGPFTTGGFAGGAYCVGAALNFLIDKLAHESNWVPSFTMRDAAQKNFEADFGMLAKPSRFSHTSSPHLIIGECKSFNRFEKRDFARAEEAAKLFPGAVLCFCTFNEALDDKEIKGLTNLAKQGRKRIDVGKQMNPVLILTARELFSQFKMSNFYTLYGDKADYARRVYMRDDMQELCEFTQKIYLGMPSYHESLEEKRRKKAARLVAKSGDVTTT